MCLEYINHHNLNEFHLELELEILFGIYTIQHNTSDTEHMLIMNARTPVITKIVDATGRPLKL